MKKKNVAVLLSLAMTLSVFAGCGSNGEPEESTAEKTAEVVSEDVKGEKEEETSQEEVLVPGEIPVDYYAGTELNIVVQKDIRDTSTDETYGDKTILKMVEEATGIHVNWTVVDPATASDRVSVMLASDEQPDVYLGSGLISDAILAQNQDMFYDLSEEGLLETYAPDLLKSYEELNMLEQVTWPDGSIYCLPVGLSSQMQQNWPMSFNIIRQDWLDQLGLDVPTTAEEFYDVLVAFRDNDMNGNGDATDEIPMTFCSGYWEGELMMLANSFGISGSIHAKATHYKMLQDGKVIPVCANDNFRAWLEFFHRLAAEGLLDMEGFSQTSEQYVAKIDEGVAGVYLQYNPDLEYETPFLYEGVEGVKPLMSGEQNRLTATKIGFTPTKDANIEAALHWWNYMHSDVRLKMTAVYGDEGVRWEMGEDGVPVMLYNVKEEDWMPTNVIHPAPSLNVSEFTISDLEEGTEGWNRYISVEKFMDNIPTEKFSQRFVTKEMVDERAMIEIELYDYINSFVASSILNGVTDESWDEHLKQLEAVGYFDWIQWYQDVEDGNF